MKHTIHITIPAGEFSIPNSWEALSPSQYIALSSDLSRMSRGELSSMQVRLNHVCRCLNVDISGIKSEEACQNLALLAGMVDFIFSLSYPDNDAALSILSSKDRDFFKKNAPIPEQGHIGRYLSRLDYRYTLDAVFCAQLIPSVHLPDGEYIGYSIDTSFDTLTCSLTALQYIEARDNRNNLPLLSAILYCPQPYDSQTAHALASRFAALSDGTLEAIALNFQAFDAYLFLRTHFSILTAGASTGKIRSGSYLTGATEALYDLSSDGYGDIAAVEQMNVIKYLTILRKKLIESVRAMHSANMDVVKISRRTNLPIDVINKIIL